ncbi:MAG: hypothetical protein A2676_03580 [Candidatus Sungbacteria bacterium RIFCSPHIGHO2_01_FULL_51_22]|nr:MAG: hypothetical protein A2676_03580 [Candidatus Sungbacteria bacterium RIFCSPHIGHO2_01_FULL_51_22]OHA04728.1 MAG: hypothetical protein A3B29_02580 [Candidatus Sungbacteria bacterium RIFCSPLOWO2_01_FULL_51_34]
MTENFFSCVRAVGAACRRHPFWARIVAINILLNLATVAYFYFFTSQGIMQTDASEYTGIARNLFLGNGFSVDANAPFVPDSLRTPGYPFYLLFSYALSGSFVPAVIAQALAMAFVPLLIYLLARPHIGEGVLRVAAVLMTIDPHLRFYTVLIGTEGLFVPVFLGGMFFMVRWLSSPQRVAYAAGAGALFGVAALTRPVFLYVACIAAVFAGLFFLVRMRQEFFFGRAFVAAVLFVLVFAGSVAPWYWRNREVFGVASFSAIGPVNIYTRLGASVITVRDGVPWKQVLGRFVTDFDRTHGSELALGRPLVENDLYNVRFNSYFWSETKNIIRENPVPFLKLEAISLVNYFTYDTMSYIFIDRAGLPLGAHKTDISALVGGGSGTSSWSGGYMLNLFGRALWLVYALLAVLGFLVLLRRGERWFVIFLGVLIVSFALATLPVALSIDARMRVVILPLYFILVSGGVTLLYERYANI